MNEAFTESRWPKGTDVRGSHFYGRKYLYFLSEKNTIYRIPREEIAEVCEFLEYMERCPDGVCEIAKEDIPTFCQGLLPVLEEHFKVKKEEKLELQQYLPPQVEFQIYLDAPQHDMITCELLAVYGEKKYNVLQMQTISISFPMAVMYGKKQRQTSSFDPVSAPMMRGNIRCFSREPMRCMSF